MPSINTAKLQRIDPSHTEINNSTDLNIMATNQVNQDTNTNTTTAATSPPHPPTNNTTLQQQNNNTNSPIQESNDVINTAPTTTTTTATTTTTDSNNNNNTQTNNNSNNDNNNNIVSVFPNGNNTRNDISQTQIDQSRSSTTSPLTINLDGIANKINNDLVRSSQGDINSIHNNNTLDNTNDSMSKIRLPITSASYSNIQDRNRTHSQQQQQQQQHNSNIPQPQSISLTSTLESSSNQLRIFQRMDEMAARLITMEEQFIKLTKTINLQNDTLNGLQSVIRDFSKQMEENVITQKQRHDHQLNMYQSQNQERQFAVDLLNSITKISSTYLNTFPTNGSNQSHNNNNPNSHYVNNNNNNNSNNNIVPVPTNYTNATQNDILLQNKYNNTSNNSISSMNNSSSMPPLFPLQSSNFIHFKKKINSSNDDFILNPNGIKRRKKNHVHQHHNNNTTTNNNNVINTNNNSSTRLNSQSAIPPSLSSPLRVNTVPILVNSKKDALTTNNKPINKTGLATSTTVPQMTNICNDNPTTNNANIPTTTDLETLNIDQFMFPTATQSQQLPNSTVPSNNGPITISNVINRDRHTDLINSEGNISSNNAAIVNTSTTNNTSNINNDLSIPNNSNHSTSLQPQRGKTTDDEILVDEEGYQEDDDEGDDDEEDDNLNHKTNTDSIVHVDDDDEEEYDEEEEDGITQDNNIHDENDDIIEDEEEDNEDDMDDNNGPQEMDAADKERKIVKRAHMMSKNKALRRIKPRVEGEDQPSKIDKGNPTPEIKSDLNYKILKAPNNVKTIWDEYVYGINGNPSIRGLEEKYGNKWRLTKNRKTFSRRKRLYKYILNGIDKGKTADEMIKILEERRLYRDENGEVKRRTIGWLQQSLTGI